MRKKHKILKDIDGNVYKTVRIGSQLWMAENLKVTRYRNGDKIQAVLNPLEWETVSSSAYCFYENKKNNIKIFGLLYNWFAVDDNRNIAPEGWHVPSDNEWKELEGFLGMPQSAVNAKGGRGKDEGGKLKDKGFILWQSPNTGASNAFGFRAVPGGYIDYHGRYSSRGQEAHFWTSTEDSVLEAWFRGLYYDYSDIGRGNTDKHYGFSVRLVKD